MISPAHLDDLKAAILLADVVGRRVQLTRRGKRYLGRCPFHRECTPSFHVYVDGHFHCFGCGEHGDVFDFVMKTEGVLFRKAVDLVAAMVGATTPRRPEPRETPLAANPKPAPAPDPRALDIWHEAIEIEDTLAQVYLTGRGLVIPEGVSGRVLRFHPRCPWGPGCLVPALVALYRDVHTDESRSILRRGLTPEGRKIGKPMALGPISGCAIKLTADEDVAEGLHVGEGVETTLAGIMKGFGPAWALGGGLRSFPVLADIDALSILVDNDANGAGQRAAATCSDRWVAAGREVFHILPDMVGADMNDVIGSVT
jgi:hypothetical protein